MQIFQLKLSAQKCITALFSLFLHKYKFYVSLLCLSGQIPLTLWYNREQDPCPNELFIVLEEIIIKASHFCLLNEG